MNYLVVQNFLDNIFSLILEHRIIFAIFWIIVFFILLRVIAKKDNEFFLKDFFKKKK